MLVFYVGAGVLTFTQQAFFPVELSPQLLFEFLNKCVPISKSWQEQKESAF